MAPIHDVYERYAADVYRFALYLSGEPADDVLLGRRCRVG